ncbi:hypothetical protein BX666DRAFT_1218249 [Dichotomocladium elegans]|nr:hypothetical protein BX666DRAFT_1218249 [Dichotomocladium elegans]
MGPFYSSFLFSFVSNFSFSERMSSAADCLLYLTSPTFIPGIIEGVLYGIGAIVLLDKSKRNKFFLSYFYLGSGTLLYAVSEVFDIVWNQAQEEHSYFPLHAALLLKTFGGVFFLLGLFRLLETWQRVGMRQGRRVLSVMAPMMICVAGLLSMIGDIFLVQQDQAEHEEEIEGDATPGLSGKTRTAVILETAGTSINLGMLLVYFIILCVLARKRRQGQTVLVVVLGTLGLLITIRWAYYGFMLITLLLTEPGAADRIPGWAVYMGCTVLPEILVIFLAIFYDLAQVKDGVEVNLIYIFYHPKRL